jgi:hypothetical protein
VVPVVLPVVDPAALVDPAAPVEDQAVQVEDLRAFLAHLL